eukprot:397250-Lingulodinium_polyedra.AAC.1
MLLKRYVAISIRCMQFDSKHLKAPREKVTKKVKAQRRRAKLLRETEHKGLLRVKGGWLCNQCQRTAKLGGLRSLLSLK